MKNILLTGAHRSGSTWVGQVIASANEIHYIHEPFNPGANKKWLSPIEHWFEYVGKDSNERKQKRIARYINRVIKYDHVWTPIVKGVIISSAKNQLHTSGFLSNPSRIIIKDPLALFSVDWLVDRFQLDLVFTVRHPAAFAASLKTVNWYFDFKQLQSQQDLMNSLSEVFQCKIESFLSQKKRDVIVEQAILLWDILHTQVKAYEDKYQNCILIKHEEAALNPLIYFKNVFEQLKIEFSQNTVDFIKVSTQSKVESRINRNSKTTIHKWKDILSPYEISLIKERLLDHPSRYYELKDW